VSIVKLEGRFVSFKETSGEVIVFFPNKFINMLCKNIIKNKMFGNEISSEREIKYLFPFSNLLVRLSPPHILPREKIPQARVHK
jgi:hypothetical protein